MQRRLAVILMADIVGYSQKVENSPTGAIETVRALRDRWLEPVISSRNGSVEKRMGDAWLATFQSATNAFEAAREIQNGLADQADIQLRIALHLGEIIDDRKELFGTGINIAARLQAEAPPGGVIISSDCRRLLDPELASLFAEAGTFALKNIAEPVVCFQWRPATSDRKQSEDIPTIAVEALGASTEDVELCDAAADMREQLLAQLSLRSGIIVLATDSTREDNGNTYVFRGRLSRRGDQVRIVLSLILNETAHVVWSETYQGSAADLFEFSDDVVRKAANALRVQINAFDGERLVALPTSSLTPSELRTRAAHAFHKATIESHMESERFLRRADTLDPGHPMTLSMLAYAISEPSHARFEQVSSEDAAWIRDATNRAVRLAPRSDFVLATRADMRNKILGDLDGAETDVRRSLKINPTYAWGLDTEGRIRLAQGHYAAAATSFGKAIACDERDPWLPRRYFAKTLAHVLARDFTEASVAAETAIELRPDSRAFWLLSALVSDELGDTEAARKARSNADRLPSIPDFHAMWHRLPEEDQDLMMQLMP